MNLFQIFFLIIHLSLGHTFPLSFGVYTLAGDGETFVLAAPNGISSNATFLGGFALVYEWRVGYWALVLDDIGTADVSLASTYGERVAISDDGRRVLVARDGNGFAPNATEGYGSVVVFDRS